VETLNLMMLYEVEYQTAFGLFVGTFLTTFYLTVVQIFFAALKWIHLATLISKQGLIQ
jgi:hypothetical protein